MMDRDEYDGLNPQSKERVCEEHLVEKVKTAFGNFRCVVCMVEGCP